MGHYHTFVKDYKQHALRAQGTSAQATGIGSMKNIRAYNIYKHMHYDSNYTGVSPVFIYFSYGKSKVWFKLLSKSLRKLILKLVREVLLLLLSQ